MPCVHSTTADGDYISLVQNITFDNGSNNSNFSVELVDNKIAESDESFEVFIKLIPDSPYDVKLGDPSVVRVYIYDDDVPIPSKILIMQHDLIFLMFYILV